MMRKVSKKLCERGRYRSTYTKNAVHLCDYASIVNECRRDPIGYCSHFIEDKKRERVKLRGI